MMRKGGAIIIIIMIIIIVIYIYIYIYRERERDVLHINNYTRSHPPQVEAAKKRVEKAEAAARLVDEAIILKLCLIFTPYLWQMRQTFVKHFSDRGDVCKRIDACGRVASI